MRNHVSGPTQFIPALNGLRAIAALMVLACHASHNGLMPKVFEQARAGELGVMLLEGNSPRLNLMPPAPQTGTLFSLALRLVF